MLGKRSSQEDLFNSDNQFLSFVGEDSFYGYLSAHRYELFRDEDFATLYCEDNGRPSVPPSLLACALLLQWYNNVPDQEAADRAKYDLRWKVALGVEMESEPFAKSTLWLFRTQLIVQEQARKLFEMSLRHARQKGYFKSRGLKVAVDTTPIFGRGAVEDTYNLLAESLRQVLHVLADLEEKDFELFASEHEYGRYTEPSFKGTVAIDWDNETERQKVLSLLVGDCERVLELARSKLAAYPCLSEPHQRIVQASDLLSKILAQDIERTSAPPPSVPPCGENQAETQEKSTEPKIIEGVAQDRIVSVHDPEMRHGRKSSTQRFDGYKAAAGVDLDSQLITSVDVLPGNAHDSTKVKELLDQAENNTGSKIETILGDSAYGSVEQRLEAQEEGRTLIAPVPKPTVTGDRFSKNDFQIDPVEGSVRCPAGEITTQWHPQKRSTKRGTVFHHKTFHFSAAQCKGCSLSTRCLKPGSRWRTVLVHEHEVLIQEAKAFQRTEEFHTLYRRRSTIEHRFARLVQLGVRKARYFGSAKVLFQLAMAAAVANLTLVASQCTTNGDPWCFLGPRCSYFLSKVRPFIGRQIHRTLVLFRAFIHASTPQQLLSLQPDAEMGGFRLRF